MTWYTIKKVHKLEKVLKFPWYLAFFLSPIILETEGLKQINDKGQTRVIWEK